MDLTTAIPRELLPLGRFYGESLALDHPRHLERCEFHGHSEMHRHIWVSMHPLASERFSFLMARALPATSTSLDKNAVCDRGIQLHASDETHSKRSGQSLYCLHVIKHEREDARSNEGLTLHPVRARLVARRRRRGRSCTGRWCARWKAAEGIVEHRVVADGRCRRIVGDDR